MTDNPIISWRFIYVRLSAVFILLSAALIALGYALKAPACFSWHWNGCAPIVGGMKLPFGDPTMAYDFHIDWILWLVLGVLVIARFAGRRSMENAGR